MIDKGTDDKNVLMPDSGAGCTTLWVWKAMKACTLKGWILWYVNHKLWEHQWPLHCFHHCEAGTSISLCHRTWNKTQRAPSSLRNVRDKPGTQVSWHRHPCCSHPIPLVCSPVPTLPHPDQGATGRLHTGLFRQHWAMGSACFQLFFLAPSPLASPSL